MEFVNAGCFYRELVNLFQNVRNLACGDADCCGALCYVADC